MKKMFMMMLLSIVSWIGAVTAAEATAPLKSNGPVAQQEAVVFAFCGKHVLIGKSTTGDK